jgi:addiction module HigA family antidote
MSDALDGGENRTHSWSRDWSVHPGELVREALEERQMTQKYLAFATGLTTKHVNQIVQGHVPISAKVALSLEEELDIPAHILVRMQADWDLWVEREKRS